MQNEIEHWIWLEYIYSEAHTSCDTLFLRNMLFSWKFGQNLKTIQKHPKKDPETQNFQTFFIL